MISRLVTRRWNQNSITRRKTSEKTDIKQDDNILHYEVRNCIFARFYKETGTPELTQLFCEVDKEFFPKAFPGIKFHRGDSWENTIAYGKDHCEFIFEKKD